MGRADKALYILTKVQRRHKEIGVACLCLLLWAGAVYAVDIVASGDRIRYPEYKKNGKPQFMVYCQKGSVEGVEGLINGVLIDVFNKQLKDINDVRNYTSLTLYAIGEEYDVIMKFWEDKTFTDCFISTPKADFDRVTKIVKGDQKVQFRSKAMDVDGVGFDADYNTRVIHIRSKVKVIIRATLAKQNYPDKLPSDKKAETEARTGKTKKKESTNNENSEKREE